MEGLEEDRALLIALAKHERLTPTALARAAGVSPSTIQRPYAGTAQTRLGRNTLDKLRAAFPEFPGWQDDELSYVEVPPPRDLVEINQVDLRYGLGGTFTEGHVEVSKRAFSREWLRSITSAAPSNLSWAETDGDSMEPTIRSREVILIDHSVDTPRFDDSIWVVVHGEIGMIKRLRQLPGGVVELHSDNQLVRPQTAVDGELHIVGRVIAVVRRL